MLAWLLSVDVELQFIVLEIKKTADFILLKNIARPFRPGKKLYFAEWPFSSTLTFCSALRPA
jgi:hypothetical protein